MRMFSLTTYTRTIPCECKRCSNWYIMWNHCHPTSAGPGSSGCNPGPHWGKSCTIKGDMDLTKSWLKAWLQDAAKIILLPFCLGGNNPRHLLPLPFGHLLFMSSASISRHSLGAWSNGALLIAAGAFKECYDTTKQCIAAWHELLMSHPIYLNIDGSLIPAHQQWDLSAQRPHKIIE